MTAEGRGPTPTDKRGGRADRPAGRSAEQRGRPGSGWAAGGDGDSASILDLAFEAIVVHQRRTGIITGWNAAATRLYGWTTGEALGRHIGSLLRTSYPLPISEIEDRATRLGCWEGELRQVTRDGRVIRVRSRIGLRRDAAGPGESVVQVTADLAASSLLGVSEDSFRLLVSRVRDYAIFMLDPRGVIVTWNEGAERIKGYRESEIVGRHFSIFYERAEIEAGKPAWELVVAEREGQFEDEGWRLRKDGTRFWANVMITALRDERGQLRGFGKVTRDITDRRIAEMRRAEAQRLEAAQLREHAEQLMRLEKAKGDFLNLASHELRGPLAVLKGYVSMFQDRTLQPDELPDVLPVLTGKVQEMELLVQQMLETARLDENRLTLRPEAFDLREATERVVARFQPVVRGRHELSLALPDAPAMVEADVGRVETVLSNLLDNAIKYSPAGGQVRCTMATHDGVVSVSVEDRGIGIAPADLDRLFTRFGRIETPENAHISGTGLGLYLSREIARRHGGDILVESSPGRGSRFTLVLPAAS
ncbi:MAG TPA: ATP-binding protein [Candidatus Dormibacteraeota bacterium]|nr:ATP-binding protein [Candidatus Dormibacteraeota bacterium]